MNKYLRIVPLLFVMGLIFTLSHQPGSDLNLPAIPELDKLLHFLVYGLLALTALYGIPPKFRAQNQGLTMVLVILFCLLYGASDELHQVFISGRSAGLLDLVADVLGAAVVSAGWYVREKANQAEPAIRQLLDV